MNPLRVYLDSSDFSILSDPGRRNDELASILLRLRRWVDEGKVVCYFSGTHLSEMAPIKSAYADASQRRSDLLVELCGRNALISQDILFAGELRYALHQTDHLPVVYSPSGDWYPDGVGDMSPVSQIEVTTRIEKAINDLDLNRKARREAKRKALKNGKPRAEFQTAAITNAREGDLDEIVEKYPMRPQDARVLSRYVMGDATAQEANEAFLESLRDPRWMMQWFEKHHGQLSPFIEWIRAPAASMLPSLKAMALHAASMRQSDAEFGTSLADTLLSSSKWAAWQDEVLLRIAMRMSKVLLNQEPEGLTTEVVDKCCPGMSVGIRSLHSAMRSTTGITPRDAKLSDFPDALHAIYAPYVDIFRADSFMSSHIEKYANRFGTKIVSKLTYLPSAVQVALSDRE
jgi:hypothetical protein